MSFSQLSPSQETISKEKSQSSHSLLINRRRPCLLQSAQLKKITELKQHLGSFSEKFTAGLDKKIAEAREEIAKLEQEAEKQKLKQQETEKASHGLLGFLHQKPPPAELVDYDSKIKRIQENIQGWEKLRNTVEGGIREICSGLDTIPDRVGSAFSALWLHEKSDAEHLRRAVESSADGNVRDISIAVDAYKQVKEALQYYGTNLTNSGP